MGKSVDHDHYERAFETWLRSVRAPYVSIEQVRRSAPPEGPIKNFDFLVHARSRHYIVDVKGKQFPQVSRAREAYWENWIHFSDLEGLLAWERHFGEGYEGLLVYCYWLQLPPGDASAKRTIGLNGRDYLLAGIPARTYAENCRRRSTRWQAVDIPTKPFKALLRPIEFYIPSDASPR